MNVKLRLRHLCEKLPKIPKVTKEKELTIINRLLNTVSEGLIEMSLEEKEAFISRYTKRRDLLVKELEHSDTSATNKVG